MIKAPTTVNTTVTTVLTADEMNRCQAVVIQNPDGNATISVRWDGSTDTLTYANGIKIPGGKELGIDFDAMEGHSRMPLQAIASGVAVENVIVHGIEIQ